MNRLYYKVITVYYKSIASSGCSVMVPRQFLGWVPRCVFPPVPGAVYRLVPRLPFSDRGILGIRHMYIYAYMGPFPLLTVLKTMGIGMYQNATGAHLAHPWFQGARRTPGALVRFRGSRSFRAHLAHLCVSEVSQELQSTYFVLQMNHFLLPVISSCYKVITSYYKWITFYYRSLVCSTK